MVLAKWENCGHLEVTICSHTKYCSV